jgi:hypothetical protein
MKYLLLICVDESVQLTPEQSAAIPRETEAWVSEMDGRGVRLQGDQLRSVIRTTNRNPADGHQPVRRLLRPDGGRSRHQLSHLERGEELRRPRQHLVGPRTSARVAGQRAALGQVAANTYHGRRNSLVVLA